MWNVLLLHDFNLRKFVINVAYEVRVKQTIETKILLNKWARTMNVNDEINAWWNAESDRERKRERELLGLLSPDLSVGVGIPFIEPLGHYL